MRVVAYDPFVTAEAAARMKVELAALDELYARADFISVHTPLTPETRGLVNRAAFAKMKKGVRIVNCARGGIVDEEALADGDRVGPRRRRGARRLRRGAAAEGPPAARAAAGDLHAAPRRRDQRGADQRRDRDRRADHQVPAARRGRGRREHAVGEPRDAGDPPAVPPARREARELPRAALARAGVGAARRVRRPDRRPRRASGDERDPARLSEPLPRGQRQLRERAGDRARARPHRHRVARQSLEQLRQLDHRERDARRPE